MSDKQDEPVGNGNPESAFAVIDHLAKRAYHKDELRKLFVDQLKDKGPSAQARLALVTALNEFVMLRKDAGRYDAAFKLWEDAAKREVGLNLNLPESASSPARKPRKSDRQDEADAVSADAAKQDSKAKARREAQTNNFRNFVQRHARTGRSWDVFEAAILLQILIAQASPDEVSHVLEALHPYQKYVLAWSKRMLLTTDKKQFEDIRLPANEGFVPEESGGPGDAGIPKLWRNIARDLHERDLKWDHWEDIFKRPTSKNEACFILFRNGMEEHGYVAQTYLALLERSPGVHTYVHVYRFRRGGARRRTRGFVVPTKNMLFLIGGEEPDPPKTKPEHDELNVDLRKPVEIIALPATASGPSLYRGLSITTNEKGKLLACRIAVRHTSLANDEDAFTATYQRKELPGRLRKILEAESRLAKQDGAKDADVEELNVEIAAILKQINNFSALEIADFTNAGGDLISGNVLRKDLMDAVGQLFKDDLKDADGRPYEQRLHIQMRSLSVD